MPEFSLPAERQSETSASVGEFDTIIVGGGPAGLSAAIYAGRAGLKTLLLEMAAPGGQAATTERIANYPGFPDGIEGPALSAQMAAQAEKFGTKMLTTEVIAIQAQGEKKVVSTYDGDFIGKTLILATGARSVRLGVPGEDQFTGRGVSYCATCDGAFFTDLDIAVVGGGDSAVEEAIYLTRFASKVTIIHRRDELRATKVVQEHAFANPKIAFRLSSVVESIEGGDFVERLRVRDVKTGQVSELPVAGVFMYVGLQPNTVHVSGQIQLDRQGYVITDENMCTSISGVFAAGDMRAKVLRQVITAAGDGALAAVMADHYISEGK
jgi:thioredoxin reductase (NADPH)